jgi:hypothetical protein
VCAIWKIVLQARFEFLIAILWLSVEDCNGDKLIQDKRWLALAVFWHFRQMQVLKYIE